MKKKKFLKKYKWLRKNNAIEELILWAQVGASGCIHFDDKGRTYIAPSATEPNRKLTRKEIRKLIDSKLSREE